MSRCERFKGELERQAKEQRETNIFALKFFAAIALVILGLLVGHALIIYGDWRCAFAECRLTIETDP